MVSKAIKDIERQIIEYLSDVPTEERFHYNLIIGWDIFYNIQYKERQYLRNVIFTECKGKLISGPNILPRDAIMLVDMTRPVESDKRIHYLNWEKKSNENNNEINNDDNN